MTGTTPGKMSLLSTLMTYYRITLTCRFWAPCLWKSLFLKLVQPLHHVMQHTHDGVLFALDCCHDGSTPTCATCPVRGRRYDSISKVEPTASTRDAGRFCFTLNATCGNDLWLFLPVQGTLYWPTAHRTQVVGYYDLWCVEYL